MRVLFSLVAFAVTLYALIHFFPGGVLPAPPPIAEWKQASGIEMGQACNSEILPCLGAMGHGLLMLVLHVAWTICRVLFVGEILLATGVFYIVIIALGESVDGWWPWIWKKISRVLHWPLRHWALSLAAITTALAWWYEGIVCGLACTLLFSGGLIIWLLLKMMQATARHVAREARLDRPIERHYTI